MKTKILTLYRPREYGAANDRMHRNDYWFSVFFYELCIELSCGQIRSCGVGSATICYGLFE